MTKLVTPTKVSPLHQVCLFHKLAAAYQKILLPTCRPTSQKIVLRKTFPHPVNDIVESYATFLFTNGIPAWKFRFCPLLRTDVCIFSKIHITFLPNFWWTHQTVSDVTKIRQTKGCKSIKINYFYQNVSWILMHTHCV